MAWYSYINAYNEPYFYETLQYKYRVGGGPVKGGGPVNNAI